MFLVLIAGLGFGWVAQRARLKAAQALKSVESEIALAMSDLSRAKDRVDWTIQMRKKGHLSLRRKSLKSWRCGVPSWLLRRRN